MNQSQFLNDVVTALASIIITAFVMGVRWGGVQSSLKTIDERLKRIEGMFELVPRNLILRPNHSQEGDKHNESDNG